MILRGRREQEEHEFNLMQIACTNAIGSCFGGSKWKPIEPFKETKKAEVPKKSREDLLAELAEVKKTFNK
jgi:hypothetical protein